MISARTRTSIKLGGVMSEPVGAYTARCELHPLVGKNGYVYIEIHAIIQVMNVHEWLGLHGSVL